MTLAYDGSGNLYTVTDPASRVYTYGYDTKGRLSSVTYPDTKTRQYLYENTTFLFALTGIIDERNARITTYGYDSNGRGNLTEKVGPDNHYAVNISDSTGSVTTTATDGFGTNLTFVFADSGPCRATVPEHAGPRFRSMPGHRSGACRATS